MRRAALCATLLVLAASLAARQTPKFRAGVDLVVADVSVLDKDRHPVRGLTEKDFRVRENGNPQKIDTFAFVELPDTTVSKTAWTRRISADVTSNHPDNHRLFCIVLDDATIEADLGEVKRVKDTAHRFIDRLGPDDLATVIFPRDNRPTRDFTTDHARLHAAVDTFTIGFRGMGDDWLYKRYSVNVLEEIAHYMIAVPDRRKAIVYFGQGVAVDFNALTPISPKNGYNGAILSQGLEAALINQMKEIFLQAERGNVNVYLLDACGLRAPPLGKGFNNTCLPGLEVDYLQTVAENTKGKAFINTNDFTEAINEIFTENSSYYLLGYKRDKPVPNGEFSRLEIDVPGRDGLTIRARRINHPEPPNHNETFSQSYLGPPKPEQIALSGVVPDTDIPMRAALAPFAWASAPGGSKKGAATVAVVVGIEDDAPKTPATQQMSLLLRAFTPEGDARNERTVSVPVRPRPVRDAAGTVMPTVSYELVATLDLPKPGRYSVRLATRNSVTGKDGSVYADVDIPDFAHAPLSLSGVIVTEGAAAPIRSDRASTLWLPSLPTTHRVFTSTSEVTTTIRIYEGGKSPIRPVAMQIRILDENDEQAYATGVLIPPARFAADRTSDFHFDLPLRRLKHGRYAATFEASLPDGTKQSRDCVFDVK